MRKTVGDVKITIKLEHKRVDGFLLCPTCVKKKGKPKSEDLISASDAASAPWPRGGKTLCSVILAGMESESVLVTTGVAVCSMSDVFDNLTGNILAARRCYNNLYSLGLGHSEFGEAAEEALQMLSDYETSMSWKRQEKLAKDAVRKQRREERRQEWKAKRAKTE